MTTQIEIGGMSCNNCVGHVTKALQALPGVHSAFVSLEARCATVEHDEEVSVERLIEAVREEGYEADVR